MSNRSVSQSHYQQAIWFSVISGVTTCYCVFESGVLSTYKKTAFLVIASAALSTLSIAVMLEKTKRWPKDNVRWLGGAYACFAHLYLLTYQLGVYILIKNPVWLLISSLTAGRAAYELLGLLKERDMPVMLGDLPSSSPTLSDSFPPITPTQLADYHTPPYLTNLGKCLYAAMRQAHFDLKNAHNSDHLKKFETKEWAAGPSGEILAATIQLGIFYLFMRSFMDETSHAIHFTGIYKNHQIELDLPLNPKKDEEFFGFDLKTFHEKLFKLSPLELRILTLKLTQDEQANTLQSTLTPESNEVIQFLYKRIGSAKVTLEQRVLNQETKNTADQIHFNDIF